MTTAVALTQFDVEDAGGRDDLQRVGGHALVVARVGRVQVLDAQLGSGLRPADGDPSLLLDHRGVVLQPADVGPRVSRHPAVQRGRLALPVGDVAERLLELQEVACAEAGPGTLCQGGTTFFFMGWLFLGGSGEVQAGYGEVLVGYRWFWVALGKF